MFIGGLDGLLDLRKSQNLAQVLWKHHTKIPNPHKNHFDPQGPPVTQVAPSYNLSHKSYPTPKIALCVGPSRFFTL